MKLSEIRALAEAAIAHRRPSDEGTLMSPHEQLARACLAMLPVVEAAKAWESDDGSAEKVIGDLERAVRAARAELGEI